MTQNRWLLISIAYLVAWNATVRCQEKVNATFVPPNPSFFAETRGTAERIPSHRSAQFEKVVSQLSQEAMMVVNKLCKVGRYAEAEYLLQKVLRLDPNYPEARRAMDWIEQNIPKTLPETSLAATSGTPLSKLTRPVTIPRQSRNWIARAKGAGSQTTVYSQSANSTPSKVVTGSYQVPHSTRRRKIQPCGAVTRPVSCTGGSCQKVSPKKNQKRTKVCVCQPTFECPVTCECKETCAYSKQCGCGPSCACGKQCGCGPSCACSTQCGCGPSCACSKQCGCGQSCACQNTPVYQVIVIPSQAAARCPVMRGNVGMISRPATPVAVFGGPFAHHHNIRVVSFPMVKCFQAPVAPGKTQVIRIYTKPATQGRRKYQVLSTAELIHRRRASEASKAVPFEVDATDAEESYKEESEYIGTAAHPGKDPARRSREDKWIIFKTTNQIPVRAFPYSRD